MIGTRYVAVIYLTYKVFAVQNLVSQRDNGVFKPVVHVVDDHVESFLDNFANFSFIRIALIDGMDASIAWALWIGFV